MVYSGSMTIPCERGCGVRKEGGIYLECGMGANGMPLEWFIKDRPILVDADALGLSTIGIKLIRDGNGIYHVLDIVGREGYPNWVDFLEEVRRFGLSRRASTTTDFGLLTADSRIMLAHSRAYWENVAPYMTDRRPARIGWDDPAVRHDGYYWEHCPKSPDPKSDPRWLDGPSFGNRHTLNGAGFGETAAAFCSGLWWEDVTVPAEREETRPMYTGRYRDLRDAAVCMPSFTYYGRQRPRTALAKSGGAPRYQLAIGLVMPLTNICIVRGEQDEAAILKLEDRGYVVGDNGDVDAAEENATRNKPPVFLVEE